MKYCGRINIFSGFQDFSMCEFFLLDFPGSLCETLRSYNTVMCCNMTGATPKNKYPLEKLRNS